MLKSKIEFKNNIPTVNINGEFYPAIAYTTYFDECGRWSDFIGYGYKMFFINVSFNLLPINNVTGFTPFSYGVFETAEPDYTEFDKMVTKVIRECPDALIFPRIHISMPKKWIEDNPNETVETARGGKRESLFSEKFRSDASELLIQLVEHIKTSDYAERIAGYQLCGGTTQEWMHHDLNGSYSELGINKFKEWAAEKYGLSDIEAPSKDELSNGSFNEAIKLYYEFSNETTSKTVEYFAKVLKEQINNEQIVGVFYGYCAFVTDVLYGLHGLRFIIDSPYIDFFSSPCCYDDCRNLGLDWGDMLPVDSVKLRGKLFFTECDIRTHLTKRLQLSRPGVYTDEFYSTENADGSKTVWAGPDSPELSLSAVRKAFCHQLIKGSGIWWFDMWGGWYADEKIMNELSEMKEIYAKAIGKNKENLPKSEVALFIDEKAYLNMPRNHHLNSSVNGIRVAAGNTGIPFDIFMVEDAKTVVSNYKAAIFTAVNPSDSGVEALELCKSLNIPIIAPTAEKPYISTPELRELLINKGVHCYNNQNSVIYCGNGILGIHTKTDGEVKIDLPSNYNVKPLMGINEEEFKTEGNSIVFNSTEYSTVIFGISDIEL